MKHLALALCLLACLSSLTAFGTGKSILFSDSYMLRAQGIDAVYYNPALISEAYTDVSLPIVNTGIFIANNSISLDTYNYVMKRDYLTDQDKEYLLSSMQPGMAVTSEMHTSIFGLTMGNVGLASSAHLYSRGSISRQYLELLLYGNQDSLYVFNKQDNNLSLLTFTDISLGIGDINIPLPESWNTTMKVGVSGSLLIGIEDIYTHKFDGRFSSGFDGLALSQEVVMNTGVGGAGFKGMLGTVVQPLPYLKLGATLDNILGFIKWGLNTEAVTYTFRADSIYVADIEDDFFTDEVTRSQIGSYSTELPMELRLAALYQAGLHSISVDWVLPAGGSVIGANKGVLSFGAEVNPLKYFPLHLGFSPGNSEVPARYSFGLGIKTSYGDFGAGYQSFDSLIPGSSSKGVSLGTYFSFDL